MRLAVLIRKWHKWLALIVGLQAVLWLISGVYMVTVDLDYIHGDQLVQKMDEPLGIDYPSLIPMHQIQKTYPNAMRIALVSWAGRPHYRVYEMGTAHLIDANTGLSRSPLTEQDARLVATYHYAQTGEIVSAKLLVNPTDKPSEIQTRRLPLWQVSFNDAISTNFYISPKDGQLVTRRHTFWRGFDFLWMLHIMDYETRGDINNTLLRFAAILGTLLSLAGFWLLFYSFNKRKDEENSEGEIL